MFNTEPYYELLMRSIIFQFLILTCNVQLLKSLETSYSNPKFHFLCLTESKRRKNQEPKPDNHKRIQSPSFRASELNFKVCVCVCAYVRTCAHVVGMGDEVRMVNMNQKIYFVWKIYQSQLAYIFRDKYTKPLIF